MLFSLTLLIYLKMIIDSLKYKINDIYVSLSSCLGEELV